MIPLSDSPPPSRWKPGQKPWKPSYIHIQEIKAKAAPGDISSTREADGAGEKAQTATGESVGEKIHKSTRRSLSRSSRSKSYSRSRSRSYSRSRSRSRSRSSSSSRSGSDNSHKNEKNKKNSLDKEWKEYYSSLRRIKNLDKYISLTVSQDVHSGSQNRAGCEQNPDTRRSVPLEEAKEKSSSQDPEMKHFSSVPAESFNSRSEWDSDSDKATQSRKQKQAAQSSECPEKKVSSLTGWNSESDSENITTKTVAISEKEEGEASSESEHETSRKASKGNEGRSPEKEPERHKSKKKSKRKHKHKRRSENKSGSHHGKDKSKRSKRKHQKLKETFHWQPPLEFGEEEEEDESKREKFSPNRVVKERVGVESVNENQSVTALNKNLIRVEERGQQRAKENMNRNTKHTDSHVQSNRNGANLSSIKGQEAAEDMDICTPEHDVEIEEPPLSQDQYNNSELASNSTSKFVDAALPHSKEQLSTMTTQEEEEASAKAVINFKWRPLKGMSALQNMNMQPVASKNNQLQETKAEGVRMEIKSKSRVRPGSLFDEVRKTARLNQRPRNQESSSEERSPSAGKKTGKSRTRSLKTTKKKSRSVSSQRSRSRGWSRSYSRSRSRSRSSSYSSR